jgi:outer membrane protein assembly factor BamB
MTDALRQRRLTLLGLLVVSLLFTGIVGGLLITTWTSGSADPVAEPALQALRDAAGAEVGEEIAALMRRADAQQRTDYFARRRRLGLGYALLALGAMASLVCVRSYLVLELRPPTPSDPGERADVERWESRERGMRVAIAVLGIGLAAGAVILSFGAHPDYAAAPTPNGPKNTPAPTPTVDFKQNWAQFRGPTGMGVVPDGDWPRTWDEESGTGILWKTQLHLEGFSSPILWGGRIFVTGADEKRGQVVCFDRATGKELWRTPVPRLAPPAAGAEETTDDTGYAAPTPVTDGKRVYVLFAWGDLTAVDFSGKLVWIVHLGDPDSMYGTCTSPIVHGGNVIVQYDQGVSAEDDLSALIALDGATGKQAWRTKRPVGNSWTSPIVVETSAGPELLTSADPWVISYDPASGDELWRCEGVSGDVAPVPVFADDVVFVMNEYADTRAIRTGGMGELTEEDILWTSDDGSPSDASSPVTDGKLLFQVHSSGNATCHDAVTGKLLWEHPFAVRRMLKFADGTEQPDDVPETVWASPTLIGARVYLPTLGGRTYIFALAGEYKQEAVNQLDDQFYATPAFGDGHIYLRGVKHLYCIGTER